MDKFVAMTDGFVTYAAFGKPVMGKIVIQALSDQGGAAISGGAASEATAVADLQAMLMAAQGQ